MQSPWSNYRCKHFLLLLVFIGVGFLFHITVSEPMHMKRNFQDFYLFRADKIKQHIKNDADLQEYLHNYGYLNCKTAKQVKGAGNPLEGFMPELEDPSQTTCSQKDVEEALKKMQKAYNLNPTGKLDAESKKLLESPRCGNSDESITKKLDTETTTSSVEEETTTSSNQQTTTPPVPTAGLINKLKPTGGDQSAAKSRRKRELEEIVHKLRTQTVKQKQREMRLLKREMRRKKRDADNDECPISDNLEQCQQHSKFCNLKRPITFRIPNEYKALMLDPLMTLARVIQAMRKWNEVTPLTFHLDDSSNINDVDILILFVEGQHAGCSEDFDGPGGIVAHSSHTAGIIHFDKAECFTHQDEGNNACMKFEKVAVHEIGHTIALEHTLANTAVMFSGFNPHGSEDVELNNVDRAAAASIYGSCIGNLNIIFDYVRQEGDKWIYNTYLFSDKQYWLYDNSNRRPRIGDPLTIDLMWEGINVASLNTFLQLFYKLNNGEWVTEMYFFSGDLAQKYDPTLDKVVENKTMANFLSDANAPTNIDAAFYDMRTSQVYFFKNDDVFIYNFTYSSNTYTLEPDTNSPVKIQAMFPTDNTQSSEFDCIPTLDRVDSVVFSQSSRKMYMFKGHHYWENVDFTKPGTVSNNMVYRGRWNNMYHYVCEVK